MIDFIHSNTLLSVLLFLLVLMGSLVGMMLLGLRLGRRLQPSKAKTLPGVAAVEGSVLGLFGLLIAFTFSGAANRFHDRRATILDEATTIGTAFSRLDLLPEPAREDLRERFRVYVDRKLAVYRNIRSLEGLKRDQAALDELCVQIFTKAAATCREDGAKPFANLVLTPINQMLDFSMIRSQVIWDHPPLAIYGLLLALSLGIALLVGIAMSSSNHRSWVHILGFCAVVTITIYVTVDLEVPRLGVIQVGTADAVFEEVRRSMG